MMKSHDSKVMIETRQLIIKILFFLILLLLIGRLLTLTVLQEKKWTDAATNLSIKTIYSSAARGEIRDRYGRLIAGNKTCFAVNIIAADIDKDNINDMALRLINLFERNGDTYIDDFPIMITADGKFKFTFQQQIELWLESQDLSANLTAAEAFNALREREGIAENLDVYEAQAALQNSHNIYPPISVKKMEYTAKLNQNNYIKGYDFDADISPKKMFEELRKKYEIDESLSDADARKILIVRNALKNMQYYSYNPVELSNDVSDKTIVELKENADDFRGVDVSRQYYRYYPNAETAAHVIGYLGKISESEKADYLKKGYSATDLIGKEGIERYYESILKGVSGKSKIEVDAHGSLVKHISSDDPVPGKDIYLTIDLDLQRVAEQALQEALKKISTGGTFQSRYGNYSYSKTFRNANVGSAVAVDVKTGEVLALANYPSFDPNLFSRGISSADWDSLQSRNPRDPLSPRPLYNVATLTSVQPGSTFKPVTGLTALDKGWNPNTSLYTNGTIDMGSRAFSCWIYNDYHGRHGALTLPHAIEVSCNYFFYDLGAGYDFYKGSKLPIDIKISDVMDYASKLGLGSKTGIELTESAVGVPSEEKKISGLRNSLEYKLKVNADKYFEKSLVSDKDKLSETISAISSWIEENPKRNELKTRLSELPVKSDELNGLTDMIRSDYFANAKWETADALNLSIGQGENAYTPVQMARYVAAVANDGTLYNLTLKKSIEGETNTEPKGKKVENKNSDAFKVIRNGMQLVTSGAKGTAKKLFAGFPYSVGAKTGSAQNTGKINPPDEVEYIKAHLGQIAPGISFEQVQEEMKRLMASDPDLYKSESTAVRRAVMNLAGVSVERIDAYKSSYDNFAYFVSFAPVDDPQIAVAVLIFQGGSGGYAGPVAREIIGKYLDTKNAYKDYTGGTVYLQ